MKGPISVEQSIIKTVNSCDLNDKDKQNLCKKLIEIYENALYGLRIRVKHYQEKFSEK